MYYFVLFLFLINLTPYYQEEVDFIHVSKKGCHLFMVLNRASDVSAADWRSQTQSCKTIIIFHVLGYGFSQRWKSLKGTPVCVMHSIIN